MVILLALYFQTRPKIGKKIRTVFCVHISIKSYRRFEDQCFPLRVGEIDIHNDSHRVTPPVSKGQGWNKIVILWCLQMLLMDILWCQVGILPFPFSDLLDQPMIWLSAEQVSEKRKQCWLPFFPSVAVCLVRHNILWKHCVIIKRTSFMVLHTYKDRPIVSTYT